MTKNKVQFPKEMSLEEFMSKYGQKDQCRQALFKLKWPQGFICPKCGNKSFCELKSRRIYQCNQCRSQTTLTSGTIFHSSNVSLRKWFLSVYLIRQSNNGISSAKLSRELEVSQNTARSMKYKLMKAMINGDNEGFLEMDYI